MKDHWKFATVLTLFLNKGVKHSGILRQDFNQCTEMHFVNFFSSGFITAIIVNPPERKLAKCTSVQWVLYNLFCYHLLILDRIESTTYLAGQVYIKLYLNWCYLIQWIINSWQLKQIRKLYIYLVVFNTTSSVNLFQVI